MCYNKEHREGFPRWNVLTAALSNHRPRRVRWLLTTEVLLYFIYQPLPLRSLDIWKKKKISPENVLWEARRQSIEIYMAGYLQVLSANCFAMFCHVFKYLHFLGSEGS